ncbi:beta-galactosidase 13-like [Ipomoea triloba]|uniref:beta-galactosidase 13-like n=1 Tax=Ipomoea triloba TaxID=35885 RepID=UPI00125DDB62|nr:beta-galactosidase 13-like [Ipomoea triloba]
MSPPRNILLLAVASLLVVSAMAGGPRSVTYDRKSMIINGTRELLFSGSIHYPRSPPEMWPQIIRDAKKGGLNTIQTYVFWNIHEPVQGQFNFEGNNDLVKFIKLIGEAGMYVTLRVGPYLEAEWNFGGFPYWLREVPGIIFRSYNEPFMTHMKRYVKMVIDLMKKEKLFAPQGGPIILAQIENEYGNVQLAYRENGKKYIKWAADLGVGLYNEIPWIMCKQKEAPNTVISACNGRHCADTFQGPNGDDKPLLWTENWTAQYRVFGDPPSQRAAEDIAFSVARFFAIGGSLVNYYMYYGGTSFGRTTSSFVTTRYYDEAPLDEFGLRREPKWSHLSDVHRAIRLAKKPMLWGNQTVEKVGADIEIVVYEQPEMKICAAFLTNNHTKKPATVDFRGAKYYLPEKSVSILPDCKTVVYNTQTIVSQHNARNFHASKVATNLKWEMYQESIPTVEHLPIKNQVPRELYTLAKDTSDYAWYSTRIDFDRRDLPMRSDILPVIQIDSLGHALLAFVNGKYVGHKHGDFVEKKFLFKKPVELKPGRNDITILGTTVGLPNSGAYMEKRFAGPRSITIQGLMDGTLDITMNVWSHSVGLSGEKLELFTEEGAKKVTWTPLSKKTGPLTWLKTYFDEPEGKNPVALRMEGMAKGMIWVNGNNLGRYWVSYLSPIGKPTQMEYHIPRAFLKSKDNLLVILEETGGNPESVEIQTVDRDTICSMVPEYAPPHVKSWERTGNEFRPTVEDLKSGARLTCPDDKIIKKIEFASFGNPDGACGNLYAGNCTSPNSLKVVQTECLGKHRCWVSLERNAFDEEGKDPCPDIYKTLAIQASCGRD